jgi:transcriptional regulator with XRE-family HTH domain
MRERRGWSLQDLADRSKLSKPYIAQLENEAANPTEATLQKVAGAFGIRLIDLLNAALGELTQESDSPAFKDFVDRYKPEPDVLPALRELQLRGRAPKTAEDWRRLYDVIRAMVDDE